MKTICPVSDLRNRFAEISKIVHNTREPVFLTKNGYADMMVMSMESYENMRFENDVCIKLKAAEDEAVKTDKRYSSKDVLKLFEKIKRSIGSVLIKNII